MSWARLPRRTLLTAVAAVAVSMPDSQREKLSIYPEPDPEIVIIETPTELEVQIGRARRAATRVFHDAHAQVQGVVGKWIGVEHAVESRVKSLVAPDEPLTPGVLYAGIAALSGSILARSRGLPLRLLAPPTLFILAANQFIPKTSHNVATYAGELEERYAPGLAEKHAIGRAHAAMTLARAREAWEQGRARAGETVSQALARVQEATGLKVEDALGKGHAVALEASEKAKEAARDVRVKAQAVAVDAQAKAAGVAAAAQEKAGEITKVAERKTEPAQKTAKEVVEDAERKLEPAQNEQPKRLV